MKRFSPERLNLLLENPLVNVSAVANASGLTKAGLDKIRNGDSIPGSNTLGSLASVLGKNVDYFFIEEKPQCAS